MTKTPMQRSRLIVAIILSATLSLMVGILSNLAATYLATGFAAQPWLVYGALNLTFIV